MDSIFSKYAEEDPDSGEGVLSVRDWDSLCQEAKIFESMECLENFYARTQTKKRDIRSYNQLLAQWQSVKSALKNYIDMINDQELQMLYEKVSNSLILYDASYESKIWMNFKILESEVERLYLNEHITSCFLPSHYTIVMTYASS